MASLRFEPRNELIEERPISAETCSNRRVRIGALRADLRTCLADARAMALERPPRPAAEEAGASSRSPNAYDAIACVDSGRSGTFTSEVSRDRSEPNSAALAGAVSRGRAPHTIPSVPEGGPDFRDLARFEWRVRQPSRRDSQCVPN